MTKQVVLHIVYEILIKKHQCFKFQVQNIYYISGKKKWEYYIDHVKKTRTFWRFY